MSDGAEEGRSLKDWFSELFARMTEVGTTATLVGAAVFAFFTQPLMRFVNPDRAYAAAVAFFLGLLMVTFARQPRLRMPSAMIGVVIVFGSMVMFASLLDDASESSTKNDR